MKSQCLLLSKKIFIVVVQTYNSRLHFSCILQRVCHKAGCLDHGAEEDSWTGNQATGFLLQALPLPYKLSFNFSRPLVAHLRHEGNGLDDLFQL